MNKYHIEAEKLNNSTVVQRFKITVFAFSWREAVQEAQIIANDVFGHMGRPIIHRFDLKKVQKPLTSHSAGPIY